MNRSSLVPPIQHGDKALHDFLYERKLLVKRFLTITAILMVVAPFISSLVAMRANSIDLEEPGSIIITMLAGVMMLLALWLNREQTAAFLGVGFGLISAYLISNSAQAGIGYGVALYIIYIFIAFIALPDRMWWLAVVGSIVGIAISNWGLLQSPMSYLSPARIGFFAAIQLSMIGMATAIIELIYGQFSRTMQRLQETNDKLHSAYTNLEKSQYQSRVLMESGLDPYFLVSAEGIILDVNQRACDLFGYDRDKLLNSSVAQYNLIDTTERIRGLFEQARENEQVPTQSVELPRNDGELIPVELTGRLIKLHGSEAIYLVTRDMTTQIQQERTEREQRELLELITQNLPVRIAYFDSKSRLLFSNHAYKAFYPIPESARPAQAKELISKEEITKRRSYFDRMNQGETVTFELEEQIYDGTVQNSLKTYVPHIEDGKVVGRVSLGINITELRATQKTLQENNVIFDHVLNNMPARIAYVGRQGDIRFINDRSYDHFDIRPEDALNMRLDELLPAPYLKAIRPHIKRAIQTGGNVVFETPLTIADGSVIIERSYYYPHIVNGEIDAIFTLHMDVTDIREAENALGKAQKLESLGVLAGGIAHDFNNLLVAILGQGSLALAKLDPQHVARRHVVQSVSAAERASILTQQMLAYSGRGSFAIGSLDLNELLQGNLTLFEVSLPKNVQLVTHLKSGLPEIEADTAQMQQLIMNLIINAGQAIGNQNGRITITTEVRTISAEYGEFWEITGDPLVPGDYVSVQVQDDGNGMTKETMSRIFDPFYTTKESGSGLGLAAALGIIRGHKGGIRLYSELGHGTVFHLLFPVSQSTPLPVEATLPSNESLLQANHTVLVIDDEDDILAVVTDMLEIHGIETFEANRGEKGIELFKQHQDTITLVLLDLMMPSMNGEEAFLALREIDPSVQIILSSGYSEAEATRHFVGRGLADFIQKPYDFPTLISRVTSVINNANSVPA